MGDVRIYTEPSPEPMRESELSEPSSDAAMHLSPEAVCDSLAQCVVLLVRELVGPGSHLLHCLIHRHV